MELKKKNICVKITSVEHAKELVKILQNNGEGIYNDSMLLNPKESMVHKFVAVSLGEWCISTYAKTKTEITMEQFCSLFANRKFKVGDKVRITKSSEYYGFKGSNMNPMEEDGVILEYNPNSEFKLNYQVKWENEKNGYAEHDLELVQEEVCEPLPTLQQQLLDSLLASGKNANMDSFDDETYAWVEVSSSTGDKLTTLTIGFDFNDRNKITDISVHESKIEIREIDTKELARI